MYSTGKRSMAGEKIPRGPKGVSVSCMYLLTPTRLPKECCRSYRRSLINFGAGNSLQHLTLRLQTPNCNKCAAPRSIMTASMASKTSVDNVYIEQLNTEDPHMERRVLRKIDFRLLPILGALYTIALIDRTNISVARISGLDDDLDLKVGNRASVVLLVSAAQLSSLCCAIS